MLYIPPHFREADKDRLHAEIARIGFATLTTVGPDGPLISHLPVVLDKTIGAFGQLRCHVARANRQWRDSDFSKAALAVFMGPDAYVSPSWYPSKKEHGKAVPTWNYVSICARGRIEVVQDRDELAAHVAELSNLHEAAFPEPWQINDAPPDYLERQLKGIVGFRFTIDALEGKMKLSQNRSEADRSGVAAGLSVSPDASAQAIAGMMTTANSSKT
ncbi:FMN-binding negative transcriptional regulator [Pseudorhodoplanes sinuspersici]|uniref:Transcriptional regulator n=1 Tax=Pseudorhodoplanes sinuspersici TaxID=1235591 RepID=A0A1W6ZZH4_9HYPH|nr:FMN-binding negative transcriptional regulator [Pseudorhodoplanes sinuspersici]ARQ02155.1 transcriptional regulator [Pseudorhodoplanes sinuspersici]RKE73964.1 PaiB family negative transcriptional regulator [Pseudorhodoplanes sinuspersici]